MKRRFKGTDELFQIRILRIPWKEHVSNKKVFWKIVTNRKFLLTAIQRQLRFLKYVMRKEKFANLTLKGHAKDNRNNKKEKNFDLIQWVNLT